MEKTIKSIILAAGKGTRMKSQTPKVLHKIFNKELLAYVIDALNNTGKAEENYIIVGHCADQVEDFVKKSAFTYYTADALKKACPDIVTIAEAEGLQAHGRSVSMRCAYNRQEKGETDS